MHQIDSYSRYSTMSPSSEPAAIEKTLRLHGWACIFDLYCVERNDLTSHSYTHNYTH